MQPLKIGASACFFHSDPERKIFKGKTLLYLEQSLAHWIMSEGALVFMIPSVAGESKIRLKDLVSELDGLVLQGGADVSPKSYHQDPMKPEWSGDAIRDRYEIELLNEFVAQKKPVLGVCRGAQLINVAFGGTLYQDIVHELPESSHHRNWEIYDQHFHDIQFEPGSKLSKLYPNIQSTKINSIHHQALKQIGKDLKVEACSPEDGIVEAVSYAGDSYVLGVQWHPEFHDPKNKSVLDSQPILKDFLAAARNRKK